MNKYTEQIIRYLSDEMSQGEQDLFKEQLANDSMLYKEYDTIKQVWEILSRQLKVSGISSASNNDERIAEILAEHDIENLKNKKASSREKNFTRLVEEIIEKKEANKEKSKNLKDYFRYSIFLLAAAVLAILIIPGKGLEVVVESYKNPQSDQHLVKLIDTYRSDKKNGIYYFARGDYEAARDYFLSNKQELSETESLLYSICLFETGSKEISIEILKSIAADGQNAIEEAGIWYLALYLVETNQQEAAIPYLEKISSSQGSYKKEAKRLLRNL